MQNINLYKQPNQWICLFATPWRGELSTIESHILHHPNGQVYLGRASGFGTPYQVMMRRYYHHNKWRALGFGKPSLDRAAIGPFGYAAIRGREQQLIDFYGGIGSPKVANIIRGVGRYNIKGRVYHYTSNYYFGNIAPYTGIF